MNGATSSTTSGAQMMMDVTTTSGAQMDGSTTSSVTSSSSSPTVATNNKSKRWGGGVNIASVQEAWQDNLTGLASKHSIDDEANMKKLGSVVGSLVAEELNKTKKLNSRTFQYLQFNNLSKHADGADVGTIRGETANVTADVKSYVKQRRDKKVVAPKNGSGPTALCDHVSCVEALVWLGSVLPNIVRAEP